MQWQSLENKLDQVYLLEQNVPNPFRSETSIGFVLPNHMEASLLIYDTNGKLVKEYSDHYKKGYNQIGISRSELGNASVLFYRLQTETGFSEIKRMILIE